MRTITINERADGTFSIEEHTAESICPVITKETAHACARRVLQLLNIKEPVVPQDWPEKIGIGEIEVEGENPEENL